MSCLCNQDCDLNINVIQHLTEFGRSLLQLQACLDDIAAKLALLEERVGDWVPDDVSEEDDEQDLDYATEEEDAESTGESRA